LPFLNTAPTWAYTSNSLDKAADISLVDSVRVGTPAVFSAPIKSSEYARLPDYAPWSPPGVPGQRVNAGYEDPDPNAPYTMQTDASDAVYNGLNIKTDNSLACYAQMGLTPPVLNYLGEYGGSSGDLNTRCTDMLPYLLAGLHLKIVLSEGVSDDARAQGLSPASVLEAYFLARGGFHWRVSPLPDSPGAWQPNAGSYEWTRDEWAKHGVVKLSFREEGSLQLELRAKVQWGGVVFSEVGAGTYYFSPPRAGIS
jgi:hypothetical protein